MYGMPVAQRIEKILDQLRSDGVKTIVLYGKPGVGKTWTAREASRLAKQTGLFDFVLWVYLSRKYDGDTLRDSIAQQLSLLPTPGELEVDEVEKEDLPKHIQSLLSKGKLLIVLDDEGRAMSEYSIMPLLNSLLRLDNLEHKLLITSNERLMCNINSWTEYRVDPLSKTEAILLLKKRSWTNEKFIDIDTLAEEIIQITQCIPSEIILMAKAFKYFSENGGAVALTRYLKEPSYCLTYLLRSGCDLVPNSILIDCQRDGNDKLFLSDSRCIHYNELIAYWITEGYLGNVSCLDKAFEKGYKIFMELVDFQVLKRVEGDYVIIKPLEEEFDYFLSQFAISDYRRGYYANACLGLGGVFANYGNWNGLVRISRDGGVAGTLYGGKQEQKVSALLLDGDALAKDSLSKFLKPLKELQVLVIFNPTLALLSHFSSMIHKLHVFVLRNCHDLENISTKVSENLTVLEISGSSSLVEIPDELFKRLPKLQSLNLSSLPIALLPPSLYDLSELKWLMLRDCSELKTMSSLKKLKNLVVLDCSGSTSLEEIQDERFANQELQMINLSNTKITNLPVIENLSKLTRLLLSGSLLASVRIIGNVASLEVIDLSNASHFHEFYDTFLGKLDNLKVLDLLGTKVSTLPGDVGNPRHLCLENCIQVRGEGVLECLAKVTKLERFVLSDAGIQSLPPISHLTRLRQLSVTHCLDLESVPDLNSLQGMEELDFSGCKSIKSLSDKSFDKMYALQKLNLSGTGIESLPSLSNLFSLRHLFLKDCKQLKTLPFIKSEALKKLEELNVGGCKALKNIDFHFFDGKVNLHTLDLSEAPLDELPSISGLVNLRELRLRNCKGLNRVPHLQARTNLEILDLSGSSVSDLPSLSNLSRLQQLMLKNCSALSLFREMGTLNILGPKVQNLPYGISGLTSLERLDLPSMDDFIGVDSMGTNSEGADSNETKTMEAKSDGCEWGISNMSAPKDMRPFVSASGTQFLQPLEKDPILWQSSLNKFHLSVYPIKEFDAKSALHFHGDDFIYRDIYLRNRHLGESDDQRLLEINGFPGYKPDGIDTVFSRANQIFFIDNKFQVHVPATKDKEEEIIQTLPSFLTACNSKQIKGFWIEKCREIETIFSEKEIDKFLDILNSVETLWVSNATSLKSIFDEIPEDADPKGKNLEYEVFQKLEKLYIECCPKLSTVLSLSLLPQKLKILKIKFCDKLGKVFDLTSLETKLQNLETLHLCELPELESIGCQLPSLKELRISNCPNLKKLGEIASAESLQNLSISNVYDLKEIIVFAKLRYLRIESCPNLQIIFTANKPPCDLEVHIRFCDRLEDILAAVKPWLIGITKLYLQGLPRLKRISGKLPNHEGTFFIFDCPNLNIDAHRR